MESQKMEDNMIYRCKKYQPPIMNYNMEDVRSQNYPQSTSPTTVTAEVLHFEPEDNMCMDSSYIPPPEVIVDESSQHMHATIPAAQWTKEATTAFLHLIKERKAKFRSPRHKKKALWEEISSQLVEQGFAYSGPQCDGRWKTLVTAYRRSGTDGKKEFAHYNEIAELLDEPHASTQDPSCSGESSRGGIDHIHNGHLSEVSGQWDRPETLLLIAMYREREERFLNPKCKKKNLWAEISARLQERGFMYTKEQCEGRWKTITKAYLRSAQCNNNRPGRGRKATYYDELHELFAKNNAHLKPGTICSTSALHSTDDSLNLSDESSEADYGGPLSEDDPPQQMNGRKDSLHRGVKRKARDQPKDEILDFLREMEIKRLEVVQTMHRETLQFLHSLVDVLRDLKK